MDSGYSGLMEQAGSPTTQMATNQSMTSAGNIADINPSLQAYGFHGNLSGKYPKLILLYITALHCSLRLTLLFTYIYFYDIVSDSGDFQEMLPNFYSPQALPTIDYIAFAPSPSAATVPTTLSPNRESSQNK